MLPCYKSNTNNNSTNKNYNKNKNDYNNTDLFHVGVLLTTIYLHEHREKCQTMYMNTV